MKYATGGRGPIGPLKYDIVPITRGKVLEIGRGPFKVWPHFIGVRERSDDTMPPSEAADFLVDSFNDLDDFRDSSFDAIVIHPGIEVSGKLADEIVRVIVDGGHLVQVVKDALYVQQFASGHGFSVVDRSKPYDKTACVVRYGAIGDAIQTAAVIRGLRQEGYHVTFMCEPIGEKLLRHDPNVDAFWVQDKDQVPNPELVAYWEHVAKSFDRFANMCETVEGTLLAMPGRANHAWPQDLRHEMCDHNYGEFMAKVAGLTMEVEYEFYPSPDEEKRADEFLEEIAKQTNPDWLMGKKWQKPFTIMWALSGSALHKTYPHQDAVIAKILSEIPHAHIITVGDDACRILEAGWEEEPRVHRRSGEIELRDSLTLAKKVDLVIGPETGVLNAVAFETNQKIVFLSHSSVENLTKHWVNTNSMVPAGTPCYPCHRMHMIKDGWKHCNKHEESSTAQCQWDIDPAYVWEAVQRAFVASTTVRRLLESA